MKLSQRFIGLLLSVLMSGVPATWAQTQAQAPQAEHTTKPADLPDSPSYSQAQAQKTTLAQATEPQESQPPQSQPDSQQPATSQPPPPRPDSQPATSQPPQSQPAESQSTAPQQTQAPAPGSQPAAQQETQSSQAGDQNPAGAATAQRGKTAGGAASRPAGAALAPAKQRNPRSLLIKLGLLAGAGVALGTAFALSQASPSRPPGAH